jgi:hypothetical protein
MQAEASSLRGINRWAVLVDKRKGRIPCGEGQGRHPEACHHEHPSPQLCHASFGARHPPALYSSPCWAARAARPPKCIPT